MEEKTLPTLERIQQAALDEFSEKDSLVLPCARS